MRDSATASLPKADWIRKALEHPLRSFRPFVMNFRQSGVPQSIVIYHELAGRRDLPDEIRAILPLLQGLAFLEMGDWEGAYRLFRKHWNEPRKGLPASMQASLWFGYGLLSKRFENRNVKPATVLAGMREARNSIGASSPLGASLAALMVEYALIAEEYESSLFEETLWADVVTRENAENPKRRFVLDVLIWLIEGGHPKLACRFVDRILIDEQARMKCGFSADDHAFLLGWKGFVTDGTSFAMPAPMVMRPHQEHYMRLSLAAVMQRPSARELGDLKLLFEMYRGSPAFSHVGGGFCFELVQCKIQQAIDKNDFAGASAMVETVLASDCSALAPYFPRVCFLKAGLEALSGKLGKARENLELAAVCGAANKTEKLLSRCWEKSADRAKIKARIKDGRYDHFWYVWLTATRQIAEKDTRTALKTLEFADNKRGPMSQRGLIHSLRKVVQKMVAEKKDNVLPIQK